MWYDVVRIGLLKEDLIDHNPAIDGKLIRQPLLNIECVSSILTMMNVYQGYKLLIIFDEIRLYFILVRMIVKRKGVKIVYLLRSTELLNDKLD
jgi:hypothetical protein